MLGALDAVPDRPAVRRRVGRSCSSSSPTCSTARWPANAAAAPGSVRCWTPPATGSATARCSAACCGGRRSACSSTPLVVATLICLVTSQVISYIKARAEASGLRGDGGLIERPERLIIVLVGAGLSGPAVLPRAVAAARGDVGAGGRQPDHLGQRLHCVRTSPGAMDPLPHDQPAPTGRRRTRRASRDHTAGWTCRRCAVAVSRSAGRCHRSGLRRGLATGARDAGIRRAQRLRRRRAVRRRAAAVPDQLRKNLARVIGVAPGRGAGRPDSCFAGLLRPLLAGGVPVAVDGPSRCWAASSQDVVIGQRPSRRRRSPRAGAR